MSHGAFPDQWMIQRFKVWTLLSPLEMKVILKTWSAGHWRPGEAAHPNSSVVYRTRTDTAEFTHALRSVQGVTDRFTMDNLPLILTFLNISSSLGMETAFALICLDQERVLTELHTFKGRHDQGFVPGHWANQWRPECRQVRQACPLSRMLYSLSTTPMLYKIWKNINNKNPVLSAHTDDLTHLIVQ